MSPSSHEINGPRPAPLKIHKGSHTIQKPSSSSSSTITASNTATYDHHQRHHQPVIIYTYSPKVIHTQARDFMALVQKLTGFTGDNNNNDNDDDKECKTPVEPTRPPSHHPSSPLPPHDHQQQLGLGFDNSFISEIPLFTPNSASEFFLFPKMEGMKAFNEF